MLRWVGGSRPSSPRQKKLLVMVEKKRRLQVAGQDFSPPVSSRSLPSVQCSRRKKKQGTRAGSGRGVGDHGDNPSKTHLRMNRISPESSSEMVPTVCDGAVLKCAAARFELGGTNVFLLALVYYRCRAPHSQKRKEYCMDELGRKRVLAVEFHVGGAVFKSSQYFPAK